jgi:hypothetical protein
MNTKLIAWLTGTLTLLMALFSFILSFNALTDLAAKHGVSIPPLFPLVVEAGVVIFSLNALYRSIHSESAKWQWILIIGSSLLAGAFNVLHAENDPISRAMAAMPSLFLLLSFETFLGQLKHTVKRTNVIKNMVELAKTIEDNKAELDKLIANLQAEIENKRIELEKLTTAKRAELEDLAGQIKSAQDKLEALRFETNAVKKSRKSAFVPGDVVALDKANEAKRGKVIKRRERVLSLLQSGLSPDDIAVQTGVSLKTIKRDITALNGKVRVTP